MKRIFLFVSTIFALMFSSSVFAQEQLRISYVRAPFNLQMIVMKEKGILDKHLSRIGAKAEWLEITSGAKQAQALASGDLDIGGVMNTTSVLMANGEGNPVRIIVGVARPIDVFALVGAKGGVRQVSELKGKTVAGPKGTALHQLLVAALTKEGLSMNDVNFIQMDIAQAFAALLSGQVDAALMAANFVINAEKEGAHVITTADGYVTPILVMTSSPKFIENHADRVKAVVDAHNEAWDWISKNQQEAITLGAKIQGISIDEAQKLFDWSHFTQTLNAKDIASMEEDMQFMLENDMMRHRIDVAPIFAPGVLKAN